MVVTSFAGLPLVEFPHLRIDRIAPGLVVSARDLAAVCKYVLVCARSLIFVFVSKDSGFRALWRSE